MKAEETLINELLDNFKEKALIVFHEPDNTDATEDMYDTFYEIKEELWKTK